MVPDLGVWRPKDEWDVKAGGPLTRGRWSDMKFTCTEIRTWREPRCFFLDSVSGVHSRGGVGRGESEGGD